MSAIFCPFSPPLGPLTLYVGSSAVTTSGVMVMVALRHAVTHRVTSAPMLTWWSHKPSNLRTVGVDSQPGAHSAVNFPMPSYDRR